MRIDKKPFGTTKNGENVNIYTLENNNGISVSISEFGAAIVNLFVPDKNGNIADIVGGYDSLSSYEDGDGYQQQGHSAITSPCAACSSACLPPACGCTAYPRRSSHGTA